MVTDKQENSCDVIVDVSQNFIDKEVLRLTALYRRGVKLSPFEREVVRAARYWARHQRKMTPFHYCFLKRQFGLR